MAGYFRDRKILEPSCYSFRSPDGKEEMIYVLENNFGFPLTKEEFYKEKEFLIDFLKKQKNLTITLTLKFTCKYLKQKPAFIILASKKTKMGNLLFLNQKNIT